MIDLRKEFLCTICDQKSNKYIDTTVRKLYMSDKMCKKFLDENFNDYLYGFTRSIIEDIYLLDQVLSNLFHVEIFREHYFRAVFQKYIWMSEKCKPENFEIGKTDYSNDWCAFYCQEFNPNHFSYLLDGSFT